MTQCSFCDRDSETQEDGVFLLAESGAAICCWCVIYAANKCSYWIEGEREYRSWATCPSETEEA